MSGQVTVELVNFSAGYGRRRILEGVDLRLCAGEFVALIGANGAGKTTLLRSLLGLVPASAGSVRVLGSDPARVRRRVGYVPQKHLFQWDFPLTVKEVVMTGRSSARGLFSRASTEDWVQVFSALRTTDIEHLADRIVGELSGGQRQRVLLARALAAGPSLLLLDEPFTGVDAPTQDALNDLYRRLAREGLSILMSTHDMFSARQACSRIVGVRGGLALDVPGQAYSVEDLHRWLRGADLPEVAV